MAERKKVSKKANVGSWLNWSLYAHSCYNYERLQSVGFALSMMPVLDDLYDGDKEAVGRLKQLLRQAGRAFQLALARQPEELLVAHAQL